MTDELDLTSVAMGEGPRLRTGTALAVAMLLALPAGAAATTRHVTTTNDKGQGSLRQKIKNADPGDTVAIPKGRYDLHKGEIMIPFQLKIEGAGASKTTIDGRGKSRVFEVSDGAGPIGISRLTITGGYANPGGGILNAGSLSLSQMTMTGNVAAGTAFNSGGAIASDGTLHLRDVTMRGNRTSADQEGFGGAIAAGVSPLTQTGSITIDRSRLTRTVRQAMASAGRSPRSRSQIRAMECSRSPGAASTTTRRRAEGRSPAAAGNFSSTPMSPCRSATRSSCAGYRSTTTARASRALAASAAGWSSRPTRRSPDQRPTSRLRTRRSRTIGPLTPPTRSGAGLYLDVSGSGGGSATARVNNSTIAGNEAGIGGGIYAATPGALIGNSIVASNQADTGADCSGMLTGFGDNLESSTSCGFTATGDLQNVNPKLGETQGQRRAHTNPRLG